MQVYIRGDSPYVHMNEWRDAARWFGRELLGQRMARRVKLNIELSDYIRGVCGSIGCPDWSRPRSFHIQINTGAGKRKKQLCTLAHEMVHMKQIIRGELKFLRLGLAWRSSSATDLRWESEPWEEEAYARERELFDLYQRSIT